MEKYVDLIKQTFDFPQSSFDVKNNQLSFHGIPLVNVVKKYGTPLRITYLPKIAQQIQKARTLFHNAIKKYSYDGTYTYCYCTKASHFSFILEEVLRIGAHIETSSGFDISILRNLQKRGKITPDINIICNGFKRPFYSQQIADIINEGFSNCIPVLDNMNEIESYEKMINTECKLGIRIAAEEEPDFEFYTSRLGIRYSDIIPFYKEKIQKNPKFKLKLLHFFINTGIKDTSYYWSELNRSVHLYCELKKICPELDSMDIGGGFPVSGSLDFSYDYEYITEQIIENIVRICHENRVPEPNLLTEFGNYTVGESGALLLTVTGQKLQNDKELWYMIDGSIINTLPDTWGLNKRFILLPVNLWDNEYQKVNVGGLTCDSEDYYCSETTTNNNVFLPKIQNGQSLHIGFFHTGAYQDALSGFGGLQHCLIPAPKHVIIYRDKRGAFTTKLFSKEQVADEMLEILGYR